MLLGQFLPFYADTRSCMYLPLVTDLPNLVPQCMNQDLFLDTMIYLSSIAKSRQGVSPSVRIPERSVYFSSSRALFVPNINAGTSSFSEVNLLMSQSILGLFV